MNDTEVSLPAPGALAAMLDQCMVAHRHGLAQAIKRAEPQTHGEQYAALVARVTRSHESYRARLASRPAIAFDENLPIAREREALGNAIAAHQVVVVCGETGSGKTTQLPKICLQLGRGAGGLIGHTQPRRIAARTVAARIAGELNTPLGELVGYQVRFAEQVSDRTLIKVMTDGVLLSELARDKFLNAYDTLIIDEAHERSLNIDFILGYLKRLTHKRPDLKIIITSATIDPASFSKHFNNPPVVEVSGRGYPVEVRWRPPGEAVDDMPQAVVEAVTEAGRINRGDVLVFLPGEREIRDTAKALRAQTFTGTEILPLYGRLSLAQQARIFNPGAGRRIVLATNVAETSVTVPNIRFVVDTGLARISRYSYRSKVQGLPVEAISQASAEQRKGRCGRVAPGVCFRLYDEQAFEARPAFTEPEIKRTNLAAVILQMKALKLGSPEQFPFIDPPDRRYVRDAFRILQELRALDTREALTPLGRKLARLPLDPRLGAMLLAAQAHNCVAEVLTITAALSINDPRERPMEARDAADRMHRRFRDKRSDFITWLNLWRFFREGVSQHSNSQFRALCVEHYLNHARLREWADVRRQLKVLCATMDIHPVQKAASYEAIHQALLAGLLTQVGTRHDEGGYRGTRGSRFHIFPGSGVPVEGPSWVMTASLVATRRLYAHHVARIEPAWIEALAGDLVAKRHHDPRWHPRRGEVVATEQVNFFGLQLVARRTVAYAAVDEAGARAVFIREALVANRLRRPPAFLRANVRLLQSVAALEDRLRRADLMADEQWRCEFYDQRLGAGIVNERRLSRWLGAASEETVAALTMTREQVLAGRDIPSEEERFPSFIKAGEHRLPLSYRFEPGHVADGVTVTIPVAVLNQLSGQVFEWLVPGMFVERMIAILRSLPKRYRRALVPLPDFANACVESLDYGRGDLLSALTVELERITGMQVPAEAWRLDTLAPHLNMRFKVLDSDGAELTASRDLAALQQDLGEASQDSFGEMLRQGAVIERRQSWDFGPLPHQAQWQSGGVDLMGYPGLVDGGDSVSVKIFQDLMARDEAHQTGLTRLMLLKGGRSLRSLSRGIGKQPALAFMYGNALPAPDDYCAVAPRDDLSPGRELEDDAITLAARTALLTDGAVIMDADAFAAHYRQAMVQVGALTVELLETLQALAAAHHQFVTAASKVDGPGRIDALSDARAQVARLVHRRFLAVTPLSVLIHLPRYVRAAAVRLDKLDRDARADTRRLAEVLSAETGVWRQIRLAGKHWRRNPALVTLRWMVEELRVSVFAQELGAKGAISVKRVTRALQQL